MNTAQLQQYLEEAVALEKQIFYQSWMILRWEGERSALWRERLNEGSAYLPSEPENPFPRILRRTVGGVIIIVAVITGIVTLLLGQDKGWMGAYGGILFGLIFAYTAYSIEKDDIKRWGDPKSCQKIFDRYKEKPWSTRPRP